MSSTVEGGAGKVHSADLFYRGDSDPGRDTRKKPKGPSGVSGGSRHLSQTLLLENVLLSVWFARGVAFFQVLGLIGSLLQTFLTSLDSIFPVQNKPWGAYCAKIPGLRSKPTESQSPLVVPMLLS